MRKTLLALLCSVVVACGSEQNTPEQQIRAVIESGKAGAEDRDLAVFKDLLSQDYLDQQGYDHATVVRLIQGMFIRHQRIHLLTLTRSLEVAEESAQAVVLVAMAGRPIAALDRLAEVRAELARFDVGFIYEENRWKVASVVWRRAEMADFLTGN